MTESPRYTIDLNGTWQVAIDPDDSGRSNSWPTAAFDTTTHIPASFAEQKIGTPASKLLLAGWAAEYEYEGKVWYSRMITVPTELQDRSVALVLRGVRWRSEVWLDGNPIGRCESLSTPHRYDLSAQLRPGSEQRLTICIDNRMIYPLQEGHINSAETATRWGGITGGIELIATHTSAIEQIHCLPDVTEKQFQFRIQTSGTGSDLTLEAKLIAPTSGEAVQATTQVTQAETALTVSLGDDAQLWWDDAPFLYTAQFTLRQGGEIIDQTEKHVGLREISVQGKNILLNGKPVFFSGYVDCCIFPQTGYPSWDVGHYRRQFEIARSHGFNHVRLHSWTPPEPFWQAADETGMLVQTELPHWSRFYDFPDVPAPADVQRYLMQELEAIIPEIQCHPAWVLFANGNELIGSAAGHPELMDLLERGKQLDSSRLYTDNTGFGRIPAPKREVDFFIQSCNWHPPKKIYDAASADTTQDFSAITAMTDRPLIGHEHGQFTMYARPSEAEKYEGVIRPSWLESIEASLAAKNMLGRVDEFIEASGIHIVRTYKENIERARRTQGLAGLQLLDIRDFPGQGHATTGILDMFWDSKGLVEPETFKQFNGAVVLLMRSSTRTFWTGQTITIEVDISNFGADAITDASLNWQLEDAQNNIVLSGEMLVRHAAVGQVTRLPQLEMPTPADGQPHAWTLTLSLNDAQNEWDLWSYPYPQNHNYGHVSSDIDALRHLLPNADFNYDFSGSMMNMHGGRGPWIDSELVIAERLSLRLLQYLVNGGRLWLMPDAKQLYDFVRTRYLPPFWSYLHFPDNVSSVMGTIIKPHPLFDHFPHDGLSNWQWYDLVNDAPAICLDSVPTLQPVVEVVDNFNRAKRLTYAFEAAVGQGKLFVSTWRLNEPAVLGRPEAQQLMRQVVTYLTSKACAPQSALSVAEVLGLFKLTNGRVSELE